MPATRISALYTDEPELFSPPQGPAMKPQPKPSLKPMVRKLEKSPTAFRTISEVGEELNVPQHVLRFWETKFTQLRPLKRGGGRRYYRSEDVTLLRQIHGLLYAQGYTIKGAQKVLKERSPARDETVERAPVPQADVAKAGDTLPMAAATPDETRALLAEMLAELKALRALV